MGQAAKGLGRPKAAEEVARLAEKHAAPEGGPESVANSKANSKDKGT